MTRYKQDLTIIITYLLVLVIPSALVRFGHLSAQFFLITTIGDCIGALALLILSHRAQPNSLEEHPLPIKSVLIYGICGIMLVLVVQILAGMIEQSVLHTSNRSLNTISLMTTMQQQPLLILAVTIAAPIMEEITFRKAIFGGLVARIHPVLAALISSLLFALLHQDGHLLIYTAIGLFLCWLYRQTGSIFTTIISHAGMNLMVTLLYLQH